MRIVFAVLACLALSSSRLCAATTESSRAKTTVTLDRNAIVVDYEVKYADYAVGEWIPVTVEYSATCNIVFKALALRTPTPFVPSRFVTGEIDNVGGTPLAGHAAKAGKATFDIRFNALSQVETGGQSGVGRLNLVLGVDKDCDLATGDADGMDRTTTIPVQIGVSTEPKKDDD